MKVSIINRGLMIDPETDFEEEYLREYASENLTAFVKTRNSLRDVIGLIIEKPVKSEVAINNKEDDE